MTTEISKRSLTAGLTAGLGAGALALLAQTQRAAADTPFSAFAFPATAAPAARTMPDRLAEVKNVKDFGAVGNGSNDDTSAIQAAVNWTTSILRGNIFFPPGTYRITSPITINVGGETSICFIGVGNASVIQGSFNGFIFDRSVSQYNPNGGIITFEKLKVSNGFAGGGGIRLGNTICASVINCDILADNGIICAQDANNVNLSAFTSTIMNTRLAAANWLSGSNGIIVCNNSTIIDCDISNYDAAIRMYGTCNNIIGGRFKVNNWGIALGQYPNGNLYSQSGSLIAGCSLENNWTGLDFIGGTGQCLITGLQIRGVPGAGPGGSNPAYGIRTRGDKALAAVFAGISVSGAFSNAAISPTTPGAFANKCYNTFISCFASNSSTVGGVAWEMPSTPCAAQFINCNNPAAVYTYANLPSAAAWTVEGDTYDISDCSTSGFLATAAGGGSGASAHRRVRWNAASSVWQVVG